MRDLLDIVRFFRIVNPIPRLMMRAFAGLALLAALLVLARPDRPADAMTPVLLLQLFAASSGFMVPARRGHFDLLLTAGYSRVRIAATHWVLSILPGLGTWLVLAGIE